MAKQGRNLNLKALSTTNFAEVLLYENFTLSFFKLSSFGPLTTNNTKIPPRE